MWWKCLAENFNNRTYFAEPPRVNNTSESQYQIGHFLLPWDTLTSTVSRMCLLYFVLIPLLSPCQLGWSCLWVLEMATESCLNNKGTLFPHNRESGGCFEGGLIPQWTSFSPCLLVLSLSDWLPCPHNHNTPVSPHISQQFLRLGTIGTLGCIIQCCCTYYIAGYLTTSLAST